MSKIMAFYNAKTIMECTNKVTKYKVNFIDFPTSRENMQILETPEMRVSYGVFHKRDVFS